MENQITINKQYNSIENLLAFLKKESPFSCSVVYDQWDDRIDTNGQMAKCIMIKKSGMHGIKIYFSEENKLHISYIIPNKIMNAYFGKSQKARRDILEIAGGIVKNLLLSSSQKKAFEEMSLVLTKIAA